ncbi:MAG: polysaccharide biosynthesis tyrosine autokinase [Chloroflexi bacterium]|nr:polysaccharide biosynthesis tyrosine autokinase [Chloroflexota bacterium]MDA1239576.1 polysaccharide biosynthesis tyrosine autokinase [Chloroflexota bacterium]
MDLHLVLHIARRWWWLVLAATLAGAALAYGVSTRLTPTYRATTTLLVVQTPTTGVVQLNDIQTAERLANTFSRLVTLRPVLDRAVAQGPLPLTPDELLKRLTVRNPPATQLLEVSARSSQPELAALIANTVAQAFIDSNASAATSRPGQVSVVEEALPPLSPVAPRPLVNAVLGAFLLLLLSAALVALLEYLDDTVKSAEQASELTSLPTLGRIEQFERLRNPREQLQAAQRPRSTIAEAYRAARTNLTYAIDLGRDRRLVLVTSPGPGEGKTTTAANLAVVFGLAGHRVCVVDTDLRRPTVHRVFGVENTEGLTNLLLAREPEFERAVQRSVHTNVSVLSSGPLPPNPSELLGSARMQEIMDWLRERFDIVLLDSPPALVVTDASVLATLVDGIVIVARAGKTRRGAIVATVEELAQTGRPIAGLILNRVQARESGYYYYAAYGRAYEEDGSGPDATARLRVEDLTPPKKERLEAEG